MNYSIDMGLKDLCSYFTNSKPKQNKDAIIHKKANKPERESGKPDHNTRKRKITVVTKVGDQKRSNVRLHQVITEINEFQSRTEKDLRDGVKKKARDLVWFFTLFVVYVMFGTFLFFYIEECSGAEKPADDSVVHKDVIKYPEFKNLTENCFNIYKMLVVSKHLNNISHTNEVNIKHFENTSYSFERFYVGCRNIMEKARLPVILKKAKVTNCDANEYTLLKYAEFVVFTVLLIGYGNTTPQTVIGRYSVIIYAIIGIPLGITMYSVAGKLLVQLITYAVRKFEQRFWKKDCEIRYLHVKTLLIGVFLLIILMFTGSAVTMSRRMENLDLTSSIYFWFVTWSTIGYGDITFKRDQHLQSPWLMMVSVVTLLFGIGMYFAIIESFSSALVNRNYSSSSSSKSSECEDNNDNMNSMITDTDGVIRVNYKNGKFSLQQMAVLEAIRKKTRQLKEEHSPKPSNNYYDILVGDVGYTNGTFEVDENQNDQPTIPPTKSNVVKSISVLPFTQDVEAWEGSTNSNDFM